MPKLRLLILLCGVLIVSLSRAADTLRLAGANDILITGYLQEFKDCSKEIRISEVLKRWRNGSFLSVAPDRVINRGITRCHHWFALTIHNISDRREDYLWNFYHDGIRFTLYELDATGSKVNETDVMSHHTPLSERDVALRSVSFRIAMQPDESKTFLLKTEPFERQNLYFPTDISTESDILSYELGFAFLLGRYYGFFLFAIIFNLCLFVVFRRRFYGMMLGYVLSLLLFNVVEYLSGVYLISETFYTWWVMVPKIVFLALTLYFNVFVFQSFTMQADYLPRLNHILSFCNNVVLFTTVLFFFSYIRYFGQLDILNITQSVLVIILLLQTLVLFINIVFAVVQRTPYILHYLIGNSLLFFSVVLYTFNTFDIIYFPQLFKPGNIIFAFAFESVYLMIVFVVKYRRDVDKFIQDLTKAEKRRRKLTVELISTQERERQRIARDIHDGIGGTVQALRLLLSQESLVAEMAIKNAFQNLNDDFRSLVHQISPKHMETLGLFGIIEKDTELYKQYPQLSCDLEGDESLLSWDLKINIYRIYQELLTNALKHAEGLTYVDVQLLIEEDFVQLLVENDGANQDKLPSNSGGNGIANIRSRVEYYGGNYEMKSAENQYIVEITIPIYKQERRSNDSSSDH